MLTDSSNGAAKIQVTFSPKTLSWTLGSFEKALFILEFSQGKVGVANEKVAVGCDVRRLVLKTLSVGALVLSSFYLNTASFRCCAQSLMITTIIFYGVAEKYCSFQVTFLDLFLATHLVYVKKNNKNPSNYWRFHL